MRGIPIKDDQKRRILKKLWTAPKYCEHCQSKISIRAVYRRIATEESVGWQVVEKIARDGRRGLIKI